MDQFLKITSNYNDDRRPSKVDAHDHCILILVTMT